MKKQTVSDIRRSMDELTSYVMKFTWPQAKIGRVPIISENMKVPKSREWEEAVYKCYVQKRSVSVNVRGLETADAVNKLARHSSIESFMASDGLLWRLCNRME